MLRRLPALAGQVLIVVAVLFGGSRAAAQDATNACVDAHVAAQRLRRDGKLRAAREQLVSCARTSCPQVLVRECAAWLSEVEATIPSVLFEATDEAGRDWRRARRGQWPAAALAPRRIRRRDGSG
ncbi:MAG: hypothetical protein WKG00_08345 [Polyangiaceae bacterium]